MSMWGSDFLAGGRTDFAIFVEERVLFLVELFGFKWCLFSFVCVCVCVYLVVRVCVCVFVGEFVGCFVGLVWS